MPIYNKASLKTPWVWNAAEREYGKQLECAVDIHADIIPERMEWLKEQGIDRIYLVRSFVLFFETEADALHYYLRWSSEDGPYS